MIIDWYGGDLSTKERKINEEINTFDEIDDLNA